MSDTDTTKHNVWAAKLTGDSIDDQIDALRQISGEDSVTALTIPVVSLAGSDDDEIRMWASEALESAIQPQPDEVVALQRLLKHAVSGEVCYWAATMLGRLGPQAVTAADALEGCLRDSTYLPARERATWALCQIGPQAASAIPTLKRVAETAPPRLKLLVEQTLEVIQADSTDSASARKRGAEEAAA